MKWITMALAVAAALLGIALHWHVVIFQTVNEVAKPKPVKHYRAMTETRCRALTRHDAETHVKAIYGPDQSVVVGGPRDDGGPPGMEVTTPAPNALYRIGGGDNKGCWVFFNDGHVLQVWEELLP
jgi:hypothetical protein